ncbi:MAG TPA: UDP-glucose/GDP-mannose dehydrogenase family protein [Candidatus Limnocylindrales bacterium]|nr:UDP-glucose/GDP-mannose dehydrogenase family protein [Candidatus Limnocylindrales bacterium]
MTITFIGHGYVGLVTACVFADFGNKVWVIGRTPEKIEKLKTGDPLFYEPELRELVDKNLKADRLHFTLDYKDAVGESHVVFIAVGTPPQESGAADLSTVFEVAEKIGKNLKKGFTVVSCKSTVTIGTNKKIEEIIKKVKPEGAEFAIASCPEFLAQGTAIQNTFHPDRVVIGSDSQKAIDMMIELHKPIDAENIITDLASAELIKYTANAMLATKISFANLIALYSEKTGANVESVLDAVGIDKRIGRVFMNPGVGYGGSCFPKDVKALIQIGKSLGIDTHLLDGVEKTNLNMRHNVINKIVDNSADKNIAMLGLSFKPKTDDIREAPSIYIIKDLLEKGYNINVYDPKAMDKIKGVFGDKINYFNDPYDAVKDVSLLVIITEWNEFKSLDMEKIKSLMKNHVIIDGRNIFSPEKMRDLGFKYMGVGR